MAKILSGREVAAALDEDTREQAESLRGRGIEPTLLIIRVGENPGDIAYERGATKKCEATGIRCMRTVLPADAQQDELLNVIAQANADSAVHGVLLLRPLPKQMDEAAVINTLDPAKDVDSMTDLSLAGVFTGKKLGYPPCTPQACMEILDYYGIDVTGKRAVVIGRSLVVGKPAAMMLLKKNATVTICHTRTKELPERAREADILITAAGHAGAVGASCFRDGQVVLDVGINVGEDGKLCGDADFDAASAFDLSITPVPGGVGNVTTSVLVRHVAEAAAGSSPA